MPTYARISLTDFDDWLQLGPQPPTTGTNVVVNIVGWVYFVLAGFQYQVNNGAGVAAVGPRVQTFSRGQQVWSAIAPATVAIAGNSTIFGGLSGSHAFNATGDQNMELPLVPVTGDAQVIFNCNPIDPATILIINSITIMGMVRRTGPRVA